MILGLHCDCGLGVRSRGGPLIIAILAITMESRSWVPVLLPRGAISILSLVVSQNKGTPT